MRLRGIAAGLVAVDEGLKKIDDAVARTKTRVVAAFGENRVIDRRSNATRPPTRPPIEKGRPRHSTLGRPPIEKGLSASPRASTNARRRDRPSARPAPVGGRAAGAVAASTDSTASPSRRASTPASPSASVGGDARETGRDPIGSLGALAALPRVRLVRAAAAGQPRRPFGIFDQLSRPRAARRRVAAGGG